MKTEVIGQLSRRVSIKAAEKLQTWRNDLVSLLHRPGTVLLTVLIHIFALWLSLKQVRLTFRILALLRLPEIDNLRRVIQSNIYLVLLAMVACFVWLNLTVTRRLVGQLKSRFGDTLPERWNRCLGRNLPQEMCNMTNMYGASHVQDQVNPGIPVSKMVSSSPVLLPRKNPPRACRKFTKY